MSIEYSSDTYPREYLDIAPYSENEYTENMSRLVTEPGFEHAIRYIMPDVDYDEFVKTLFTVKSQSEFQLKIMGPFLEYLAKKTTAGITIGGVENINDVTSYTFLSNHRDIVLDASFLNLCFIREKLPITQIAIGNNLLIYDWIRDLVKINRSFIVKRDVKRLQALEAARQLSGYIHYVIAHRHESIWIAQREGRAKDSNDVTQESLLKMLSLGGEGSIKQSLMELNVVPVSISYEYDPNDYLKVREFVLKRRDPEFKKSQHDDLFSMETGLMQFKGNVHFQLNSPINNILTDIPEMDRQKTLHSIREIIDSEIYNGYKIYPINYIAFDRLMHTTRFAEHYTAEMVDEADHYFAKQKSRLELDNIAEDENAYVDEMFLRMYANPLINQLGENAETVKVPVI